MSMLCVIGKCVYVLITYVCMCMYADVNLMYIISTNINKPALAQPIGLKAPIPYIVSAYTLLTILYKMPLDASRTYRPRRASGTPPWRSS